MKKPEIVDAILALDSDAKVQVIEEKDINSRNKQKTNEQGLTQQEIWQQYGISSRHL